MLSPFPYIFACLSLSLLFRQSLLYDSQFNISIRTRLISTSNGQVVAVLTVLSMDLHLLLAASLLDEPLVRTLTCGCQRWGRSISVARGRYCNTVNTGFLHKHDDATGVLWSITLPGIQLGDRLIAATCRWSSWVFTQ